MRWSFAMFISVRGCASLRDVLRDEATVPVNVIPFHSGLSALACAVVILAAVTGAGAGVAHTAVAAASVTAGPGPLGVFGDQGVGALDLFMTPKGETRTIEFTTTEGTNISVDVAPGGKTLIFDLLGHIYRIDQSGGEATLLTAGSGVALNYHPRFSPDGKQIAFISDRSGQANVWIMDADGQRPRLVLADMDNRYYQPAWAPDGRSIYVVKGVPSPGRAWEPRVGDLEDSCRWRQPDTRTSGHTQAVLRASP